MDAERTFNPNRAVISISTLSDQQRCRCLFVFQSQPGCHLHFDPNSEETCNPTLSSFNPNRAVISISTAYFAPDDSLAHFFQSQPGCHLHFDRIKVTANNANSGFQSQPGCHLHFDSCFEILPSEEQFFQSQPGCHLHFDRQSCVGTTSLMMLSLPPGLPSPFRLLRSSNLK